MDIILDINSDIYPISVNQKFSFALSTTLALDGKPDEGTFDQSIGATLADKFEYVMYGKVYRYTQDALKVSVYISFGGLLLMLKGDPRNLQGLEQDNRVYLLMRRV
mmetsp:Transcript_18719/g.31169  ORF Transcript_18719/g.31169 Transcript_18719/m.31169 type:complete len:106 (-) Transcript_18719:103-420(-)